MPKTISAVEAKLRLRGSAEIALLDIRERGQYGEGHPFFAVNLPYSRLEIDAPVLLPNVSVPIVLFDNDDGIAQIAATRFSALGYSDVSILIGGCAGWAAAGQPLFKGVNVPSKTFGEFIEHIHHTPMIDAAVLKRWQTQDDPFLLFDVRTPAEYSRMTIPGAISCPNGELAYRLPTLLPNEEIPIILHCAGRTRGIIGAETLRNLGVPNPIYALRNGTQGWTLAGCQLERGIDIDHPPTHKNTTETIHKKAKLLRSESKIPTISPSEFRQLHASKARTVYLFDVRTEEEYRSGHLAGCVHAPGGQLVQATDHWIAVRNAVVVLTDDNELRASVTAMWLRRMGHDAVVLINDAATDPFMNAKFAPPTELNTKPGSTPLTDVDVADLPAVIGHGSLLLDLNPSILHRTSHLPGARWTIRPRLKHLEAELTQHASVLLACDDRRIAELAAIDIRALGARDVRYITGTVQDWKNAGMHLQASPYDPSDEECIDFLFFVHDRHEGNLDAARRYLEWELNLLSQVDSEDLKTFF